MSLKTDWELYKKFVFRFVPKSLSKFIFTKYTKSFILIYFFIILAIILNRLND